MLDENHLYEMPCYEMVARRTTALTLAVALLNFASSLGAFIPPVGCGLARRGGHGRCHRPAAGLRASANNVPAPADAAATDDAPSPRRQRRIVRFINLSNGIEVERKTRSDGFVLP